MLSAIHKTSGILGFGTFLFQSPFCVEAGGGPVEAASPGRGGVGFVKHSDDQLLNLQSVIASYLGQFLNLYEINAAE